ncbi:hypothetical protein KCU95_g17031, partial [Aureobasidium melanogenum]
MTGLKFDKLFGINIAEELITADFGRGKTARYNSEYFQSIRDMSETEVLKAARAAYVPKTIEELHNQYLNFQIPSAPEDLAFVEAQLRAVAIDSVAWWTEFVRTQSPEDQQQCGHRKNRTEVSEDEAAEHHCKERESADAQECQT